MLHDIFIYIYICVCDVGKWVSHGHVFLSRLCVFTNVGPIVKNDIIYIYILVVKSNRCEKHQVPFLKESEYDYPSEAAQKANSMIEKWKHDADAIVQPDGSVKFVGPRGVMEDEAAHVARLTHNARMRMHRSFTSGGVAKKQIIKHVFPCVYVLILKYKFIFIYINIFIKHHVLTILDSPCRPNLPSCCSWCMEQKKVQFPSLSSCLLQIWFCVWPSYLFYAKNTKPNLEQICIWIVAVFSPLKSIQHILFFLGAQAIA